MTKTKQLSSLSLQMSENEYHAMRKYNGYDVYSYSNIARYARKGFPAIAKLFDSISRTPEIILGSVVDCLVTNRERFNDEYGVINDEHMPPPAEKTALEAMAATFSGVPFDDLSFIDIIRVMDGISYKKNQKDDTRINNVSKYKEYYNALSSGKTLISNDDYVIANEMCNALLKHKGDIFGKSNGDIEYLYQSKFIHEFTFDDGCTVAVKIMPDVLKVNHKIKTILPVDLKTSSMPAYQFPNHWIDMRYDIQASVYTDVLQAVLDDSKDFCDYTIEKYVFVDISKEDMIPLSFTYDPRDDEQITGLSYNGYKYKHWTKMLEEIKNAISSNSNVPDYIDIDGYNDILSMIKK